MAATDMRKADYSGLRREDQCAPTGYLRDTICPNDSRPSSREPHPLLFGPLTSLKVEPSMKDRTETLEIGSAAPDFCLSAANREGVFTLGSVLDPLILEFLRGTW